MHAPSVIRKHFDSRHMLPFRQRIKFGSRHHCQRLRDAIVGHHGRARRNRAGRREKEPNMDKPRRQVWWDEYASREFKGLDPESTIAILPIAAIEQHGPHLPVGVDAAINRGMLETLIDRLPDDLDIRILPIQQVGKSNEHLRMPGTLTLPATTLIEAWTELGLSVARAGLRKLVIVNSHGGNDEVMGIVARELRVRADMLVVKSAWSRLAAAARRVRDGRREISRAR